MVTEWKRHCNHLICLASIFTPAALCWWAKNNNNNHNNNNNNIYGAVIMANHNESSSGSADECRLNDGCCQLQTKPTTIPIGWLGHPEKAATIRIHHRHLLLLITKDDTHFTVPRRVDGWADLGTAIRVCTVQPVSMALYRSGCHDKHNCLKVRFEPRSSHTTVQHVTKPINH